MHYKENQHSVTKGERESGYKSQITVSATTLKKSRYKVNTINTN